MDIIEHIRSDVHAPTFDNLARWVTGIRNLPKNVLWSEVKNINADARISVLNYVVLFNLKKTPGGRATNEKELAEHALQHSDLLKVQFSFYDPDIVICCGNATSRLFNKILFPNNIPWPNTTGGIPFREFLLKKYVIAYNHPQAIVNKEQQYYGIVNAVKEILNKKN